MPIPTAASAIDGRHSGRRDGHGFGTTLACLALTMLAAGCAAARREPITTATATQALAWPDADAVRVATSTIHHPLLHPIAIERDAPLTADAAALLAVALSPDLRAARHARALARAQVIEAGLLPNPQLTAGFDEPFAGPDTATAYAFGLSWDVTALIGRGARRSAAERAAASVDLDIAWQEWQVSQEARLRFFALIAARARAQAATSAAQRSHDWRTTAERAAQAHVATDAEVAAVRSTDGEATLTALDATNEAEQKRLALARVIGAPTDWRPELAATAWPTTAPDDTGLADGIESSRLDLAALRLGYESEEETLRAAVLARFPKISVGLTHARDPARVQTVGPNVAVDLPIFDRNQAGIARELATRERLRDEYVARVHAARQDLAAALAEARTQTVRIATTDQLADAADHRAAALAEAAAHGLTDVASAIAARTEAARAHEEALASRQRLVELRIAIESASGRYLPVDPGGARP